MCLVAFAIDTAPGGPLLVAANRDEYHERPTAALQRWRLDDGTEVLGGRDLRDGGMWMGATAAGRVAWLTNVRQAQQERGARSRGELVTAWLQASGDTRGFLQALDPARYGGFNLVVGDLRTGGWTWLSNRDPACPHDPVPPRLHWSPLAPGIHTLSNASLDTPWPKSRRLARALAQALGEPDRLQHRLGEALTDLRLAEDSELPRSGVPIDVERALSSAFVRMPASAYGTRTSTLLRMNLGRLDMDEWTHAPDADAPSLADAVHRRETLTVA